MLRNLKHFNAPEIEEKVLQLWKEKDVFKKTLKTVKGKNPKVFKFWEGPPTANGRPGIHHILARSFKDVVLRFKTMQGFLVPRKGGWDTHGLPVEIQVEKQLGLTSKKQIEEYGVAEFNKKCKESVWVYKSEWEKLTERMGFWLDLKNPYVTYHKNYIESLWWIIKQAWDKGLMYKGHKIVNWCYRCGTSLSSHELAQGYKEVIDNSVYVKFKLLPKQKIVFQQTQGKVQYFTTDEKTYILSWTTTPWTLPGNVALAVGEKIDYVVTRQGNENFILAKDLVEPVLKEVNIKSKFKGKSLIGISYQPLFDIKELKKPTAYKIYPADFVTTTDGTGVVHTAVMYGEDDYNLGKKIDLPQHHTVNEQGEFTKDVKGFEGMVVKHKETEEKIFEYLEKSGNLFKKLPYTHEYPHCWRCSTPLLYYARSSWFVAMSKLKKKLLKSNESVNWVPKHIKNGRFGEWLSDIKDWNFSRERYWGTPLPIWECSKCGHTKAVGSYDEVNKLLPSSTNKYILVRHGEAGHNIDNIINSDPKNKDKYPLTKKGIVQVKKSAALLKKLKTSVDAVFTSDFIRTKQTAQIIADSLGVKKVISDKNLREIYCGTLDGGNIKRYHEFFSSLEEKFMKRPPEGESLRDVAGRIFSFIKGCEKKFKNSTIMIVGHEYTLWMFETILSGWSQEESVFEKEKRKNDFIELAGTHTVKILPSSRDDQGFADYHKPYVDELSIPCDKCKASMKRVKEVADVWFDSGSMPFAQDHFPFVNQKLDVNNNQKNTNVKNIGKFITYPADYICEAVDQTRGWFYTLLAVATLLEYETPYKNAVCLGHINDKYGQKMSKSKGNIVDPWAIINKHGIDAVRWYFYSANDPGEPKNFDENEVAKILRQLVLTIYNSFVFLNLYGKDKQNIEKIPSSKNILDKWIIQRIAEVCEVVSQRMDKYDFVAATRNIEEFVDDLSRWHIRRSRRRFQKPENAKDHQTASVVLAFVLLQLSKIMAPFTPFFADALYQSIKKTYKFPSKDSVHLELWPEIKSLKIEKDFLSAMKEIRNVASSALAKRAEAGIKVRQPLSSLSIKHQISNIKNYPELLEILKDEVNVKNIIFDSKIKDDFELDTNITPELKAEGLLRELIRSIQDLRQSAGFVPKDKINVWIKSVSDIEAFVLSNPTALSKEVGATKIYIGQTNKFDAETETKIGDSKIWLGLKKN